MEDLAGKLNAILNDPHAMEQVSALAGMLGSGQQQESLPQPPPPQNGGSSTGLSNLGDLGALAGLLGNQQKNQSQQSAGNTEMMQTVLQVMPLLNAFQQEDATTRLLMSLRPLLSRERQKKLDEAAKLLKVFRLLPMLKSKGIL